MPNQLTALWRQYNPDDARGDDEITSQIAQQYPEQFKQFPEAVADYGRIQKDIAEAHKPDVLDYVKQPVGSMIRGATETIAGLPEAIAIGGTAINKAVQEKTGIDIGPTEPEESGAYKLGQGIRAAGEKIAPRNNDELANSFWATKVPSTLGSIAAFIAGGGLGKAIAQGSVRAVIDAVATDAAKELVASGMEKTVAEGAAKQFAADQVARHIAVKGAEAIPTALMGAGTQGASAYEEAISRGATPEQALSAYLYNLPVGAAMAAPVHGILGEGGSAVGKIARDTALGTGVMAGQQVAGNVIARETYDPNRSPLEGVGEGAAAGGIVTAALSGLAHSLNRKSEQKETKGTKPEPAPANPSINPVAVNYAEDPAMLARVQDVIRREMAGETGPSFQTALNGIYALPEVHALYDVEKRRLQEATTPPPQGPAVDLTPPTANAAPPAAGGNPDSGVTAAPTVPERPISQTGPVASAASVPLMITKAMEAALRQIGVSQEQINKLSPQQAHDILTRNPQSKLGQIDTAAKTAQKSANDRGTLPVGTGGAIGTSEAEAAALQKARLAAVNYAPSEARTKIAKAEAQVDTNPSEAQKQSGNYQMGHLTLDGLNLTIENPKGSVRSGVGPDGKPWRVEMPATYGYVKGTEGADGDRVDMYIGDHPESGKVWVVDQIDPKTGKFDEHKTLLGFQTKEDALKTYAARFSDGSGQSRIGGVTEMTKEKFVEWVKGGDTTKRLSGVSDAVEVVPTIADKLAFESAQVKSQQAGLGKKSAAAFTETSDPKELYKDATADANDRNLSRKQAVLVHLDGQSVTVGTAYSNGGKRYVTVIGQDGKPMPMQLPKAIDAGYKLIASLKTKEPTKAQAVTYSIQQWTEQLAELRARAESVKSGGVSAVSEGTAAEILGKEEARGGQVVSTPNASPYEMKGGGGRVDAETLGRLVDAIGEPKWTSREEAFEQIGDGFTSLKPEEQTALLNAFSPRDARSNEVDYVTGFDRLRERLYEHYETAGTKEEISQVSNPSGEEARAAGAAEVQGAGTGNPNGGPGEGGATPGSSRQGTTTGTNTGGEVSHSARTAGERVSNSEVKATWDAALETARANGLDVTVLQGMNEGGVHSPRVIALTVADPLNPTHDNVVLLFHEIGHEVFQALRLPSAMEAAFHRAIAKLAMPEDFRIKFANGVNVARKTVEEILVERAARNLAAEGFNPQQSQGLAQRFVRMLKQLYLRAEMAIQRGFLGKDHVNPDLAQAYFEERLRSFLAGDKSPLSFISFAGGPQMTAEQRGETFKPSGGGGALSGEFNYGVNGMQYREALPETMAAMRYNSAAASFSERVAAGTAFTHTNDPHVISRELNSPDKVKEDVAAYNALNDIHLKAFEAFNRSHPGKLTFEQFVSAFTNADTPATEKIAARNQELIGNGHAPVDPTLRPHDLVSEASQMQAADKGLQYAWSLREHWAGRRKEAESFLKGADTTLNRNNLRLDEMTRRYTDMDLQLQNAKSEVKSLVDDLGSDIRQGVKNGRKLGMLTQVIAQIDGRTEDPIKLAKQYEPVLNRLYARLTGDHGNKFVDILQKIAGLDIDWKNTPAKDAVDLIAKMVAPGDPQLKELENRSLAAITVAFAKTNEHVMALLQVAKSDALEERAELNEIIKKSMGDSKDAMSQAKAAARKLPRLAVAADRLLTKIEDLKDENHAHLDQMQRARAFIDMHSQALPALSDAMVQLERTIGARLQSWEANNGAEYYVAKPGATADQMMAGKKKAFKLAGVEGNEDIMTDIQTNNAWLASVPEDKRGAVWNTVREMTTKLEHAVALAGHELVIKRSAVNTFLGSIVDKLDAFGLPSARAAAMRMRRYLAERHAATAEADNLGVRWKAAEARAMDALGLKDAGAERFQRSYFQAALSFAEKNPELRAAFKGNKEAFDALLPRLRKYLESDPDTAARLARPGGWSTLEAYYRATYPAMEYINAFRKKMGIKIQETGPDGFKIEREPIGSTFFTAMRRISRDAVRMYQDMRELGWLGTNGNHKLQEGWISDLYDADPDNLRASVRKLFTPAVWREFVQPLTEMEGRAAFYGPRGVDGLDRIALRENVSRAFDAADGDAVKFAETLYDLDGSGREVAESRGAFVGRTLQAFQEFFDSIHNTQKDLGEGVRHGIPTPPRLLQDARISESWPGAWMDYQTYGRYEMHQMVNTLAAQSAFGRNIEGMRADLETTVTELGNKAAKFRKMTNDVMDARPGKNGRALDKLVKAEVEKRGESYTALSQASRNLESARYEQGQFENLMKTQAGLSMELRPFMELVSAMAGATVQGPGTALMQVADFGQSFLKLGLGPTAMRVLRQGAKSFAAEQIGTLAQLFHGQIAWNADRNARRVRNGIVDPDARRKFKDALSGLMNDPSVANNAATQAVFKVARGLRLALSSGLGSAKEGSENAYVTLKPHAFFSQVVHQMQAAFIDGWTGGFEDIVENAAKYYADPAHAGDFTDPAHKFEKLTDLGYKRGFMGIGSDERGFKYFSNALARYGMSLEHVARDLVTRRERDGRAPALTDDQFRVLASQVMNEVTLESNPATRASAMFTNPILRMAAPLVGWSISKSQDSFKSWRNPDMTQTSRNAFKAFATGMLPYLALVPAGLALAWLRDKYDEKVLGKKANRQDPLTSFGGMVDATAWVGSFGVWGDIANSMLNRDTQRPFSVDNRVFFISSMLAAKNALQNWYEQGSADYQTVYRPMIAALGGSGYLQYAQILNNAMSLDNPEARVTAKINATNYLRTAGRQLGMDVRASGGGDVLSTPIRPAIGQMVLSAYANDHRGFTEAYREAVAVAKAQGEPDPAKYVSQKFAGYNPLRSVFKTEPSQLEYHRILNSLDEDGRQAVSTAMRLFNGYVSQLGLKPDFGRQQVTTGRAPSLQEVRRMAASY